MLNSYICSVFVRNEYLNIIKLNNKQLKYGKVYIRVDN